jgi:hypothetical protein
MNILIVGKTRMTTGVCVGGLALETNRSVRLLPETGINHNTDTPFKVGQIWDMEIVDSEHLQPPHVEDVRIKKCKLIGQQDHLMRFLGDRIKPWCGRPNVLFDGRVRFTQSDSGFIARSSGVPKQSTGFWISDRKLERNEIYSKLKYSYISPNCNLNIPFVGFDTPIQLLKAGTLLRVSLARWWKPEENSEVEERCYLQLSGWYLD